MFDDAIATLQPLFDERGEKTASAVRCVPVRTERLVSRSRTWFPVLAVVELRPPSSVLHLSFIVCRCVCVCVVVGLYRSAQ